MQGLVNQRPGPSLQGSNPCVLSPVPIARGPGPRAPCPGLRGGISERRAAARERGLR